MALIRVLLVDDHSIILDGLESILSSSLEYNVIGRASNGIEAVNFVKKIQTDIVLMDIEMPEKNGIEATREIKRKFPQIKVLAITMYNDSAFIKEMLDAGAEGYILKNSGRDELLKAMERILKGEKYVSQPILETIFKRSQSESTFFSADKQQINLTQRELQLIKMICNGFTNKEIGDKLSISSRTVETHRSNLMRKINVTNVSGIIQFSIRNNLND